MRTTEGLSLIEALATLALAGVLAMTTLPHLGRMRASALAAAGARHLAVTFHALRWNSVAQGVAHGLWFLEQGGGWVWYVVRDGNGNGLRMAEIVSGTDATKSGPHRLEDVVSRVTLGFPAGGPFPEIPPGSGSLDTGDPIQIGNTSILAFGPGGTSSSGTLYLTGGHEQLYAVVLYGKTAKIRVWRFIARTGRWTS
jgi:hypothetical protein